MKKPLFTGSGTALVTPFHADGSVNYEAFDRQLEFQLANGTDACLSVCDDAKRPHCLSPNMKSLFAWPLKKEKAVFLSLPVQAATTRLIRWNWPSVPGSSVRMPSSLSLPIIISLPSWIGAPFTHVVVQLKAACTSL